MYTTLYDVTILCLLLEGYQYSKLTLLRLNRAPKPLHSSCIAVSAMVVIQSY